MLEVEMKFAQWVDGILSKLNEAQIQRMLSTDNQSALVGERKILESIR